MDLARLPLPPYSPELNPAEQTFRMLRGSLSNRVFDDLPHMETELSAAIRRMQSNTAALARLTAYAWWREGIAAIRSDSW